MTKTIRQYRATDGTFYELRFNCANCKRELLMFTTKRKGKDDNNYCPLCDTYSQIKWNLTKR